jgi:hypothetical protein
MSSAAPAIDQTPLEISAAPPYVRRDIAVSANDHGVYSDECDQGSWSIVRTVAGELHER